MAEKETISGVRQRQGILSKIQNAFGLGYATKEDLRELDRKLRDYYYTDFRALRRRWEEIYLATLNAGAKAGGDDLKKVIQVIDRVAEKINRADYGYAGLMDRKGAIREEQLATIFNYDKALGADIQSIADAVARLYDDSEAARWAEAAAKVRMIKSLVLDFESKWDSREKQFRPLEV